MRKFTCDKCGETFETTWTEAEANAEYEANFDTEASSDRGILCDDCYEEFWNWAKDSAPELTRKV